MTNDTQTELEALRAEHEQLLKDLKLLRFNFSSDYCEPGQVNPELSFEAVPSAIESIAFTNLAGEAERTAVTKEEKERAYLLRQVAVYIYTHGRIFSAMSYLLGTFTGEIEDRDGNKIPRMTHLEREDYGKRYTSQLGLKIDTRRNKQKTS